MGWKLADFTPKQRAMMGDLPAELGFKYKANPEEVAKHDAEAEEKKHEDFIRWLDLRCLVVDHDRMDKRTTNTEGLPDFRVFANGYGCMIEFKAGGRQPSDKQKEQIAKAIASGVPVLVTEDVGEAINFCVEKLHLNETHAP